VDGVLRSEGAFCLLMHGAVFERQNSSAIIGLCASLHRRPALHDLGTRLASKRCLPEFVPDLSRCPMDSTWLSRAVRLKGACEGEVMKARLAIPADSASLARIYNQGIEGRTATFETRPRTTTDMLAWFDEVHPIVAVEERIEVLAFAATSMYRPRACYAGIAEVSVYVDRHCRGRGLGRLALSELARAAEQAGFWKLVSRVFTENAASRALTRSLGFREVGIYEKHGCLDGVWRDVLIVELVLPVNQPVPCQSK